MLRKSTIPVSFLTFILTLELWVLSYFQVSYIRGNNVMVLEWGNLRWLHYEKPPPGRVGGWYWEGFNGLKTLWVPDVSSSPWGDWMVSVPLWIPTFMLAVLPIYSFRVNYRHRKREKSGLCVQCGYDLRGHRSDSPDGERTIHCPECGTEFAQ